MVRDLRRRVKKRVKGVLARARNVLDTPILVIMYHRVTILPSDPQLLAVAPSTFRDQLLRLRREHPIVRFEEDWSAIREPSVAITFDDGYRDNAVEALPILEELGIPATFFVATATIGTDREFWWDDLERLVLGDGRRRAAFVASVDGRERAWRTGTSDERRALYQDLHRLFLGSGAESREALFGQLRAWAELGAAGRPSHRAMTVEEVQQLGRSSSATVGAHTVTHSVLSAIAPAAQREELQRSRAQLEAWTGRPVETFSYPFGQRTDYTPETVDLCRQAGFRKAAVNFPGQAHRWTDPLQIPRHVVRNWSADEFARRMREFWTA
jgi:peptidoglycan/xylan/chitin deacetylase (PgdA/CDA1 family)